MNNRILYIDDNIDELDPLVERLKDEKFEVKIIKDSNDALHWIKSHPCDIIILDLDMPPGKMTGNELFPEIRKLNKKTPIIIVSGYTDTQKSEDYKEFINNEARAIFNRTDDVKSVVNKIKEIKDELNTAPGGALEEWIEKTKEPDAVLLTTKQGKKYTARDVLNEIKMRTPVGLQFERDLNQLTIDLVARGKEKIG